MPSMNADDRPVPERDDETPDSATAGRSAQFETVDWDDIDRSRSLLTAERLVFLVGLGVVGALYLYERYFTRLYLVSDWTVETVDWLFLCTLVVVVAYGVVPAVRHRDRTASVLRQLLSRPAVVLASGYLAVVGFAGIVGPALFPEPTSGLQGYYYNPPVGFSTEAHVNCVGETTGGFSERCHGTLQYPLGTGPIGERVELMLLAGARPTVYVALIGGVVVAPVATAVGVAAGLRGGLVDRLLMTYVDLQLSLPAIIFYLFGFIYFGPSLLVLLVAFGLLSWGGVARLVRSEVIQRREDGHVIVARSLGASEPYIAVRHILPNVTNTLFPALGHLLALLVLSEAGVAFLGFHEISVTSWGSMISESINAEVASRHLPRAGRPAHEIWWLSTFPAIALALTMLSFKLLGDGLRDVLDPREAR